MNEKSNSTQAKGAHSSRLQNLISPVDAQYPTGKAYQRQATSSKKFDANNATTDSDFFTLTAEDNESQMDPVLIMKNLSNLNSGTSSVVLINEMHETTT